MKKILCVFSKNKDFKHPKSYPSPVTFYGYDSLLKEKDFGVSRLDIFFQKDIFWILKNPFWLFWRPFELLFYLYTGVGFALGQLIGRVSYLNKFDLIYGINDTSGVALAFLKKLGLLKTKIVWISAGLVNNLTSRPKNIVTKFFRWFLPSADLILSWSPLETSAYKGIGVNSEFVPLEADVDFYTPDYSRLGEYIFSVGRDTGRDIQVLFKALKISGHPLKLIADDSSINAQLPKNIELMSQRISFEDIKNLYKGARIVVVPTKEISRVSGQTALLEALAMGKPIIASKTKAMTSAYPGLKNGRDLIWYQPGNVEDLSRKIHHLWSNKKELNALSRNARRFAQQMPQNWFYNALKDKVKKLVV